MACLAMTRAPGLIRFAARYTRSLHDAEDAYQRAMEIALTSAPVAEPRRFLAWLHVVVRNEAIALAEARRREAPGADADVAEAWADRLEESSDTHAVAEWRERYRAMQDALAGLTDAQRICLMLQSAGASYKRIGEITGFSLRKIERSVLEGRASLYTWEVRLASGAVCARIAPMIDRVASGEADARERRTVSRHVRHCGPCRALLRERRESNEWLAALVPAALVGGGALGSGALDPSPALAWWERLTAGATVRAGNALQMAVEMPTAALAKVGAGTAAVAVAGVAGAPLVVDAVRDEAPGAPVAAIERIDPAPAARAAVAPVVPRPRSAPPRRRAADFAEARRAAVVERERRRAAREPGGQPAASPAPAAPPAAEPPPPPPPSPSAPSSVALEFGP